MRAAAVAGIFGLTSAAKIVPEIVAGGAGQAKSPDRCPGLCTEHADTAVHTGLSKVNVRLLNGAFEVGIAQSPVNAGSAVIADLRIELAGSGGSDRRLSSYPVRNSLIFLKP